MLAHLDRVESPVATPLPRSAAADAADIGALAIHEDFLRIWRDSNPVSLVLPLRVADLAITLLGWAWAGGGWRR